MRELREFLTRVITAKRKLKGVYYTTRAEDAKADSKELVVATITLQKTMDDLIELYRKERVARKVLKDRKAQLLLKKWSSGLPSRVKEFSKKSRDMKPEHLTRYYKVLLNYIDEVSKELTKWIEDIETLKDLPRPPRR